jgi:hypothetical protein
MQGQYAYWCLCVYCAMVVHFRHVILHSVFACYKRYDWNMVQTIKAYIKIQYNVTIKSLNSSNKPSSFTVFFDSTVLPMSSEFSSIFGWSMKSDSVISKQMYTFYLLFNNKMLIYK